MTDFSPLHVKTAARYAKELAERGETADFVNLTSTGEIELGVDRCIVRILMDDTNEVLVSLRVIDQNGRHWFPEY